VLAESLEEFRHRHHLTIERLYAESGAGRFEIAGAAFAEALYRGYRRRDETGPDFKFSGEIDAFLVSLHVGDLALAIACRQGNEIAWREFRSRYHRTIESVARALISDPVRALETAESLYADLYGLRDAGARRASPFDHYHGRAGLGAWLRVVIARREADLWRAEKMVEPIESITERIPTDAAGTNHEPCDPDRARYAPLLSDALTRAIAALEPARKLLLSYYYVQGMTLAEIGRLQAEHESTVSRRLSATRNRIRREVERSLRVDHRLSNEQIDRCFDYATADWPFNLATILYQQAK
jgi:RNA polymerase sigma-70 factor